VVEISDSTIQNRWIFLQEVCNYLGVKRHTVMPWIEQRGMSASKAGNLWRFKTAGIDEWVRNGSASNEQKVPK
jgi:excisionase family DNA binding protein